MYRAQYIIYHTYEPKDYKEKTEKMIQKITELFKGSDKDFLETRVKVNYGCNEKEIFNQVYKK